MGIVLLVYAYNLLFPNYPLSTINNDSTMNILTHPITNIGVDPRYIIRELLPQLMDQPRLFLNLRELLDSLSLQYIYSRSPINPDLSVSEIIDLLNKNEVSSSITTQEAIQAIVRLDIQGENISQILHEMNPTLVPHNPLIPTTLPREGWGIEPVGI